MIFSAPGALVGLLFVPAFLLAYILAIRQPRRYTLRYSSLDLVRSASSRSNLRRHVPPVLFILAVGALALAVARPHAVIPLPEATGTVILTIDASGSMASADIYPSRIEAAKAAVREFVSKQPEGIKIGVVAFAGGAYLVAPPTYDREQIVGAVDFLTLGRGTNVGEGLQVALAAILNPELALLGDVPVGNSSGVAPATLTRPVEPSSIVLLSDGASTTGPDPLLISEQLKLAGVTTYTVGLGTEQGVPTQGRGRFMRLNQEVLQEIADQTGGKYFSAESASDLKDIYGELGKHYKLVSKEVEVTYMATAVGLVLSVLGGVLGMLWSSRLP